MLHSTHVEDNDDQKDANPRKKGDGPDCVWSIVELHFIQNAWHVEDRKMFKLKKNSLLRKFE